MAVLISRGLRGRPALRVFASWRLCVNRPFSEKTISRQVAKDAKNRKGSKRNSGTRWFNWKAIELYDMRMTKHQAAIATFRELHESGCFVLPNPWDAGSAFYLEHIGFKALATTSAGFAFSKALADGPEFVSRDLMLEHFRELVEATSLPVNADFQNGYADDPEGVAESVRLCVETGVAGLSIEDNSGQSEEPLYDFDLAVERIKAARAAINGVSVRSGSVAGSPSGVVDATGSTDSRLC